MDFEISVVINEPQLTELIHEVAVIAVPHVITSLSSELTPEKTMPQTLKLFREWFGPAPKDHFGAQDQVECPKCGNDMYVLRRMPDSTQGELQTLECLNCRHTQTRTVGGDGEPQK